jgi:hypothetical protein
MPTDLFSPSGKPVDFTPTTLTPAPPPAKGTNKKVIEKLSKLKNPATAMEAAQALAAMFESTDISDDGTVAGRLEAILAATEGPFPGAHFAIPFDDSGFREEFQDPWPDSSNQVGHFLTAVNLSYNPAVVRGLRFLLDAPDSMPDEAVALRLVIGHEKAADPNEELFGKFCRAVKDDATNPAIAPFKNPFLPEKMSVWMCTKKLVLDRFRLQFMSATGCDVDIFQQADDALGGSSPSSTPLNLAAAKGTLSMINVDPNKYGNSYQDLVLSLYGWRLGKSIKGSEFRTNTEVADWIRANLMEPEPQVCQPGGQPTPPQPSPPANQPTPADKPRKLHKPKQAKASPMGDYPTPSTEAAPA